MKRTLLILSLNLVLIMGLFALYLKAEEDIAIIEDIKVELIKETPEIKIEANVAIEYLDYTLEQPSRIVIDPLGMVYCDLDEALFSGANLVREVSIIKAPGSIPAELPTTYYPLDFIVIELKNPVEYNIVREEKLVVKLGKEILPPVEERIEEVAERAKIEITEVVELEEEIEEEEMEEEEIEEAQAVGKEFFDEEKFPMVQRYSIEAGDELEISVWQHPDLLREIVVRPDGYISFPLAGEIRASGLTAERLCKELALRLSKTLRKPEVSVIITGFGSKGIFVLGAVNKPGLYPYKTRMTALKAISVAESWQTHAYLKSVLVVKRGFSEEAEVIRVNLWDVIKKGEVKKDIALEPGDIVYVPQSFIGNLGTFMDGLRFRFGTGYYISHSE